MNKHKLREMLEFWVETCDAEIAILKAKEHYSSIGHQKGAKEMALHILRCINKGDFDG